MGRTVKFSAYESEYEENEYRRSARLEAKQRRRIRELAQRAPRDYAEDIDDDLRLSNHFLWNSRPLKHRKIR